MTSTFNLIATLTHGPAEPHRARFIDGLSGSTVFDLIEDVGREGWDRLTLGLWVR